MHLVWISKRALRNACLLAAGLVVGLTVPGAAKDAATVDGEVASGITVLERSPYGSKKHKKQLKDLKKARKILAQEATTRTGKLLQLAAVSSTVKRWVAGIPGLATALDEALDALSDETGGEVSNLESIVGSIEEQKARRKVEKQLRRAVKKLESAASAKSKGKRKKWAKSLAKGSKQADRAWAIVDAHSEPSPEFSVPFGFVSKDGNDVLQVYVTSVGADTLRRQVSTGTGSVSNLQSGVIDGEAVALYHQDGAIHSVELEDPQAAPRSLTPGVAMPDGVGSLDVDGAQGIAILVPYLTNKTYVIDIENGQAHDLDRENGEPTFLDSGFLLNSIEDDPFLGRRLDHFTMGANGPEATPIGGPSVDGKSVSGAVLDTESDLLAFLGYHPIPRTTSLCVTKLSAIAPVEVHPNVATLRDPLFQALAGAWISGTDTPTLAYQEDGGATETVRFTDWQTGVTFDIPQSMIHDQPIRHVFGSAPGRLAFSDGQNRVGLWNGDGPSPPIVLTEERRDTPEAEYLPLADALVYEKVQDGAADEVWTYDYQAGQATKVDLPDPDVSDPSDVIVRGVQVEEVDADEAVISVTRRDVGESVDHSATISYRFDLTADQVEVLSTREKDKRIVASQLYPHRFLFVVTDLFNDFSGRGGEAELRAMVRRDDELRSLLSRSVNGVEALALPFLTGGK